MQGLSLGFLISELWWPCSAEDALAAGLVQQLPDGRVAVSTADSSARMVCEPGTMGRAGMIELATFDSMGRSLQH
eukprot:1161704-Pelagomonas_calceolata.AAC.5